MKRSFLSIAFVLMLCAFLLPSCMSAHEHTYSTEWSSDADGHFHAATCWHTDERIDMTEHTWDDGVLLEIPQEFTEGKVRFTCTVCQAQKVESIPMLHVHTYADKLSFDEQGHYYAATCGCENERQGFTIHTMTATVTAPTCVVDGFTTHTCVCGYTFTDSPTDATGHDFVIGYTNEDGTHTLVCQNKKSHIQAERCAYTPTAVTPPTCTEGGYTTYTCVCGHMYTADEVAPIQHSFGDWVSLEDGTHARICMNDPSHVETEDCSYEAELTSPTCTESGYTTYTCLCGHTVRRAFTEPKGHTYTAEITPPSCTKEGYTTYTCLCGYSEVGAPTKAKGHAFTPAASNDDGTHIVVCENDRTHTATAPCSYTCAVTPPTCTEEGFTTHTCACGYAFTDTPTSPKGHTLTDWTQTKAPTCTEHGEQARQCIDCTYTETGKINPVGHQPASDTACTEAITCTVCGATLSQPIGHAYIATVTPPTCTKDGYTTYACRYCTDTYVSEPVSAPGHASVIDAAKAATCTEDGLTEGVHCATCQAVLTAQTVIPSPGHAYVVKIIENTCVEDGYTMHTCSVCTDTYTDSPTEALGHTYIATVTQSTCTEDGYTTHICSTCTDTYVDTITKAPGHTYVATVIPPTCSEDGYTLHTCSVCTDSYTDEPVGAPGHVIVTDASKAATCTEDGLTEGSHCTTCQTVYVAQQIVPALGHDYQSTVTDPTCTEDGYTTHVCRVCADSYVDTVIQALSHVFENHVCTRCYAAESAMLTVHEITSPVYLVSQTVIDYIDAPYYTCITSIPSYASQQGQDVGLGITLSYTISGDTYDSAVTSVTLTLTSKTDTADSRHLSLATNATSATIYNLMTGTEYHFRFDVTLASGAKLSDEGTFRTAKTPRLLNIGGLNNVRDIGGWQTVEGLTVAQGLLYRGTEMDGKVAPWHLLTDEGRQVMRNLLGIRTDMDLRDPQLVLSDISPLGADVTLFYYDAVQYADIFTEEGKENMRAIFADLANPDNYPIYLHCTYGSDRTGTVCLLLEGLLGVSRGNAVRDYELSALVYDSKTRDVHLTELLAGIDAMEGNTFQKKIENYLLSAGVTAEQIQSIRDIFLK